eukprot:m.74574 g.74574  ORF g.74574 m.74574 type:complete len:99 (-) comp20440_c0_seq6:38-334(-)
MIHKFNLMGKNHRKRNGAELSSHLYMFVIQRYASVVHKCISNNKQTLTLGTATTSTTRAPRTQNNSNNNQTTRTINQRPIEQQPTKNDHHTNNNNNRR